MEVFTIIRRNGESTFFRNDDGKIFPRPNFELAYKWYLDNELTVESEILMNIILKKIDKRLTRALSWVYSKEEGSNPSLI